MHEYWTPDFLLERFQRMVLEQDYWRGYIEDPPKGPTDDEVEAMLQEARDALALASDVLVRVLLGWCPHCGAGDGGHKRWCTPDGPLYEGRRYEALAMAQGLTG